MDSLTPKAKTGKFILTYGLILGLLSVAFNLMLYLQDAHITASQDTSTTVISVVLSLGITIAAILLFKKANGGYLKLGQAVRIAVGLQLIAAVIIIVYNLILATVLDPEYVSKVTEFNIEQAMASNPKLTPEIADQQREMSNKFFFAFLVGGALIVSAFFGAIYGLLIGLFAKKSEPTML